MEDARIPILSSWDTFYLILGAAAATLTGLMFVVISLMASARVRVSTAYLGISAFNSPTVVHFCAALLVALIVSAPWQVLWSVSLLLGLLGLGSGIYTLTTVPQMRRMEDYQPKVNDWVWYFSVPLVLYAALIVAALLLPTHPGAALFAVAAVAILLIFTGIRNAWDLITYLAVELVHPEGDERE